MSERNINTTGLERYRTAIETISEVLGLACADPEECVREIRRLRAAASPDAADEGPEQFMYWSVQFGHGETSETDDEAQARAKFDRWKMEHPEDRVDLVKFYGRSVEGHNLEVEYDRDGRRLAGEGVAPRP